MPPSLIETPLGLARGLTAALTLTVGATCIHTVQLAALPLALVHRPTFLTLIDHSQAAFAELLFAIHCTFGPQTTMVVSTDEGAFSDREWRLLMYRGSSAASSVHGQDDEQDDSQDQDADRTVLVSNHQTLLDWTYLWFLTLPLSRSAALKIILKQTPKYVPVFGPGMLLFQFIFLSRNRARDVPQLHKEMDSLLASPGNKWLLVFPEGTILTTNTSRITGEFALKAGVPEVPTATLIPRSTGLAVILPRLFARDHTLSAGQRSFARLLDVTLSFAYADTEVNHLVAGRFPGDVFTPRSMYATYAPHALRIACHVARRVPPANADEVPEWTRHVWQEKEQRVHVMREGKVPGGASRMVEVELSLKGFWPRHLVPYVVGVPAVGVAVVWCAGKVCWW